MLPLIDKGSTWWLREEPSWPELVEEVLLFENTCLSQKAL